MAAYEYKREDILTEVKELEPSGLSGASRTATLVFTDIEGSTKLVDMLGAGYADVLKRHQTLILEATEKQGGRSIGTRGDSFFLVFDKAENGVLAAIEIQRALKAEPWPSGVTLKVRIGVHKGDVSFLGEEVVGLDVHRAARICDAGHGGQIVISQDIRSCLEDAGRADGSFELRGIGRHRLKDLRYPEVLFDVQASGLDKDFFPVRSLDARKDNLTNLQHPIFGRDAEVSELRALLETHPGRVITLVGSGGIGKSSIARATAEQCRSTFPDGVHFIDLGGLTEPQFVLPTIAQAIGVRDFPNRPLEDDIISDIGPSRRLLVLDTMEHLLKASDIIGRLIKRCPELRIIVTSRATLGLGVEKLMRISALKLPEADGTDADENPSVKMFVSRAQEGDSSFEMTAENTPVVVEIVRKLEGVPLALELGAARMVLLTPEELLSRLSERLKLLRSGKQDVARHRTLRGAIEWSDELLDDQERDAFHRLSVFAGGFRFRDGEGVLEEVEDYDGDPMDLIASLVSKSLLERNNVNGEPRFAMLDMIREFATEKLKKAVSLDEMRLLHCDHFARIVETSGAHALNRNQREHVIRLTDEVDNIRAALHFALEIEDAARVARFLRALQWYWFTQAQLTEAFEWTNRAAALARRTMDRTAAGLIHEAVCVVMMGAGDYGSALPHGRDAVDAHVAAEDLSGKARAELLHALCSAATGEIEDPSEIIMACIEQFGKDGDVYYSALGLIVMGEGARMVGMLEPAEECYNGALAQLESSGDTFWKGALTQNIGHFRLGSQDVEAATTLFSQSFDLGDDYDYEILRCLSVAGFAGVSLAGGDAHTAARFLGAVNANLDRIGVQFEPADAADIARYFEGAKAALGESAYDDHLATGAASSWTGIKAEARALGN